MMPGHARDLEFRPYPLAAVAGGVLVFPRACIVGSIMSCTLGPGGTTYQFLDGITSLAPLIHAGDTAVPVKMYGINIELTTGLFLVQTGANPVRWTVTIASLE